MPLMRMFLMCVLDATMMNFFLCLAPFPPHGIMAGPLPGRVMCHTYATTRACASCCTRQMAQVVHGEQQGAMATPAAKAWMAQWTCSGVPCVQLLLCGTAHTSVDVGIGLSGTPCAATSAPTKCMPHALSTTHSPARLERPLNNLAPSKVS